MTFGESPFDARIAHWSAELERRRTAAAASRDDRGALKAALDSELEARRILADLERARADWRAVRGSALTHGWRTA